MDGSRAIGNPIDEITDILNITIGRRRSGDSRLPENS